MGEPLVHLVAVAEAADGHPWLRVLVPTAARQQRAVLQRGWKLASSFPPSRFIIKNVFVRFLIKEQRLFSIC